METGKRDQVNIEPQATTRRLTVTKMCQITTSPTERALTPVQSTISRSVAIKTRLFLKTNSMEAQLTAEVLRVEHDGVGKAKMIIGI